jgi:hypothetical protein
MPPARWVRFRWPLPRTSRPRADDGPMLAAKVRKHFIDRRFNAEVKPGK